MKKIVGKLVSQESGKTTQNKSVSILDYMAQKNRQKLLGRGKCNTGYTNGIPRYKLPFSAKFTTRSVFQSLYLSY